MYAIYINDKEKNYTDLILDGKKTIETRNKNTLGWLCGEQVAIIRTGKGKPKVVGFCEITKVKHYWQPEPFKLDYDKHFVDESSEYFIRNKKYGYVLENPIRLREPREYLKINGTRSYAKIVMKGYQSFKATVNIFKPGASKYDPEMEVTETFEFKIEDAIRNEMWRRYELDVEKKYEDKGFITDNWVTIERIDEVF